MDKKSFRVVKSGALTALFGERYVVVDAMSGEILDDAQGYGYKTKQKAYAAMWYKSKQDNVQVKKDFLMDDYIVVQSKALSNAHDLRYVVVEMKTGRILDDAQGYGYKTPQKAYAAFESQHLTIAQRQELRQKKEMVRNWSNNHESLMMKMMSRFHHKEGYGIFTESDSLWVKQFLKDNGIQDLPFAVEDLLKYGW